MGKKIPFWPPLDFLVYWLPPFLWATVILALSGDWGSTRSTLGIIKWILSRLPFLRSVPVDVVHFWARKVGHAVAYGTLYLLWFRAWRGYLRQTPGRAVLWSLGLCLLLALIDESHQSLNASRSGSLWDVALDLGGAGLMALITIGWWTPRPRPLATAP